MSNTQKRRGASPVAAARAGQRSAAAVRTWVVAAIVAVAVLVGVLIAVTRSGDETTTSGPEVSLPASVLSTDGVKIGLSGAKVDVQLWEDLQCPACKAYAARVDSVLEKYIADGTVALTIHPVAILDDASTTNYSTRSGSAVVCAASEGKFWPYAKLLYDKQPPEGSAGLTDEQLVSYGSQVGLTSTGFKTCVTTKAQAAWIATSTKTATDGGLTGTPTISVEGEKLSSGTVEELQAAVDAAA